jgi:hypothetical protein
VVTFSLLYRPVMLYKCVCVCMQLWCGC